MQRAVVSTFLGLALIGALSAVVFTSVRPDAAYAFGAMHDHDAGGHDCGRLDDTHTRLLMAYVEISLALTAEQTAALHDAMPALESWREAAQASCERLASGTLPEIMVALGAMLDDSRRAVDEITPKLDVFYGTLTEEQRATLDGWIAHHGKHPS